MKNIILNILTVTVLFSYASAEKNINKAKVYAVVNGENITDQTIAIALKNPKIIFSKLPKDTQKNILSKMVNQALLSQHAMKTDIVKDPMYINTLNDVKQNLALQLWMKQKSEKVKVSNKELKAFYKKNKNSFKVKEQLKAKHILVKDKKTAQAIIKQLKKSKNLKKDFIKIAKEKSIGPSGKNGGDLGWFPQDAMVPEFSNAAKKLKINSITKKPVKTQFGFHVIYLEDKKKASTTSFKDAKETIKQKVTQEKLLKSIEKTIEELKKKATIVYK
ncbi:Peptidyl-prolyl cis-trans isomerase PpiC [hydrothermal vent metagenome]|uniref:peptidylprolyl isomerase n=1 Tax=hydrothermal vent metagenome TaxID=652676 RepID=A0A3B1E9G8_9ZZZZ